MDKEVNVRESSSMLKNIFDMLKEIFSGNVMVENREEYDLRMKMVYDVEKECGGTDSIRKLEKNVQIYRDNRSKKNLQKEVVVQETPNVEEVDGKFNGSLEKDVKENQLDDLLK